MEIQKGFRKVRVVGSVLFEGLAVKFYSGVQKTLKATKTKLDCEHSDCGRMNKLSFFLRHLSASTA